ncbi:hypothetical protein CISIN_1g0388822mg, partial [Citrus sinensis]
IFVKCCCHTFVI